MPGITGLWQVSERSRLSFDQMVQLDIQYIENWSALLDIKILLLTVGTIVSRDGSYGDRRDGDD
jgi:lipopolysaccharide/colanic/teichoic acid biosynthesis glycosyltransferase